LLRSIIVYGPGFFSISLGELTVIDSVVETIVNMDELQEAHFCNLELIVNKGG